MPDRTRHDQLRLMTLAARLYHERGLRQCDIAAQLGVSQPRVSRLLADAEKHGIVRTVVVTPDGYHPELEEAIEDAYGLRECHVVEVLGGDDAIAHELGAAAAQYFCASSLWGLRVGFTSWSSTLREMARRMGRARRSVTTHVIEMLGHLAPAPLQHQAVRATLQLSQALSAEPVLLRAPGVITDPALRQAVLRSPNVERALTMLDDLDLAFVGVGPVDAAGLPAAQAAGAIAQLNQRLIDAAGHPVSTPFDEAVVGITLSQLRRAGTRAVVAGGPGKLQALHAALRGKWVDVLVTDLASARELITQAD